MAYSEPYPNNAPADDKHSWMLKVIHNMQTIVLDNRDEPIISPDENGFLVLQNIGQHLDKKGLDLMYEHGMDALEAAEKIASFDYSRETLMDHLNTSS